MNVVDAKAGQFVVSQHVKGAWHVLFRGERTQARIYWDSVSAGRYGGIRVTGPDGQVILAGGGANGDAHRFKQAKEKR